MCQQNNNTKSKKGKHLEYSERWFINCNNKCRTFCNKITNIFTMRFLPFLN